MSYKDKTEQFKKRAQKLVNRMTVKECTEQMVFGAKENKELSIKAYNWWNEALHGVARSGMSTVFPQAIGMAATFDAQLLKQVADVISTEGRAKFNVYQKYADYGIYKGITFWTPNVNIFRDPRWGRGQETYGEDPYLTSKLGVAFVEGLQGDDEIYMKTAACAKHFAVHSGPEGKRHEFDAVATPKDMAETYLPAFNELVDAKVAGVMGAYNRTNGEPCCGSYKLMTELLREKWGFDGYFTSDCWAIADFHLHHHITETAEQSVALALKNGCDLNCGNVYNKLMSAYEQGLITEEEIRKSTVRLMTLRLQLGMVGDETPFDSIPYSVIDCDIHRKLNEEVARKSMVLLKNNAILPLDKSKLKNVAVIGPNANSIVPLNGNYHGTANQYFTVLESIREALPQVRVNYTKGSHLYEHKLEDPGYEGDCFADVKAQVDLADVVILVVGMDETIEGEEILNNDNFTGDKNDLLLPETQRNLIKTVCERKTPVIVVNMTGSAVDFGYGNNAEAIVQAWYPGAMGGKALSDLIFGEYSPSGRLPVTFYKNENSLPDFEDYTMDGRTYKFIKEQPLYPFGYGLSYTSFEYDNIKISEKTHKPGDSIKCSVKVTNTGHMVGDEVVQCYLKDIDSSYRQPVHKLCGMKRVLLIPGEDKKVKFEIDWQQFLSVNEEGDCVFEPGKFRIYIGGSQPDGYSQSLMGSKCSQAEITID